MSTLDQAMNYLADVAQGYTWSNQQTLNLSRYNCSGTITGSILYRVRSDKKAIVLWGRVYISSYSRSGSNPGFTFTALDGVSKSQNYYIGIRGESAAEMFQINFSTCRLTTTETFTNATGTRLTCIIPGALIML